MSVRIAYGDLLERWSLKNTTETVRQVSELISFHKLPMRIDPLESFLRFYEISIYAENNDENFFSCIWQLQAVMCTTTYYSFEHDFCDSGVVDKNALSVYVGEEFEKILKIYDCCLESFSVTVLEKPFILLREYGVYATGSKIQLGKKKCNVNLQQYYTFCLEEVHINEGEAVEFVTPENISVNRLYIYIDDILSFENKHIAEEKKSSLELMPHNASSEQDAGGVVNSTQKQRELVLQTAINLGVVKKSHTKAEVHEILTQASPMLFTVAKTTFNDFFKKQKLFTLNSGRRSMEDTAEKH